MLGSVDVGDFRIVEFSDFWILRTLGLGGRPDFGSGISRKEQVCLWPFLNNTRRDLRWLDAVHLHGFLSIQCRTVVSAIVVGIAVEAESATRSKQTESLIWLYQKFVVNMLHILSICVTVPVSSLNAMFKSLRSSAPPTISNSNRMLYRQGRSTRVVVQLALQDKIPARPQQYLPLTTCSIDKGGVPGWWCSFWG